MRIWSIDPQYLDTKGLVSLWRETLLAKHVLEGKTKAYKNHPQLLRFKQAEFPIESINEYLFGIYDEAVKRGYNFNKDKLDPTGDVPKIEVTQGQVEYEFQHLLKKLKKRDKDCFQKLKDTQEITLHPLFKQVPGDVEEWEVIQDEN